MYENTKEENMTVKKISCLHMIVYEEMCNMYGPGMKVVNTGKGAI